MNHHNLVNIVVTCIWDYFCIVTTKKCVLIFSRVVVSILKIIIISELWVIKAFYIVNYLLRIDSTAPKLYNSVIDGTFLHQIFRISNFLHVITWVWPQLHCAAADGKIFQNWDWCRTHVQTACLYAKQPYLNLEIIYVHTLRLYS